ncbi:MAG: glucose-6-phosphate dehydrogenase, partial [Candidatus Zixiibacteriota bacterium]
MSVSPSVVRNPFLSRFMRARQAGPFVFVIFGASGDLTKRKLIPALFNLYREGFLDAPFCIFGFARRDKTDEIFRQEMMEAIREFSRQKPDSDDQLYEFVKHLHYVTGSFGDTEAFHRLKTAVTRCTLDRQIPHNVMYYLATPPGAFEEIIRNLNEADLVTPIDEGDNWTRMIIEKPFGHDRRSAWALNGAIHQVFNERQVYRIDHYLGKETVQNILVFRLGNSIFEPLWNRRYIDNVQISVSEAIGIGSRAGYFDKAGIIRDMIQSHIMQIFTLIAMEPPASFETTAIRDEKVKVLKALRLPEKEDVAKRVVRAQYTEGSVGGEHVKGYLEEEGVPPDSKTETYLALRADIDNWRWADVPFYIRAGKRLPKRVTEVTITFKSPPHLIFDLSGCESLSPNVLRLRIQPEEGISLSVGVKRPGQTLTVTPVRMDFDYATSFGVPSP